MWKMVAVISGLSVAALGIGGAALAETASAATPAAAATVAHVDKAHAANTGKHDKLAKIELKDALHGTWVTKDGKTAAFLTHDAIQGQVTAVSSSSITIKAADHTSETFSVAATTKVHTKGDSKTDPGSIGQVKVGDKVGVIGTGTTTLTATDIIDHGVPKPHTAKTQVSTPAATTTS